MRRLRAAALLMTLALAGPSAVRADVTATHAALSARPFLDVAESGWRMSPGDDPRWATPQWDDTTWARLRSTRPRQDPDAPAWTGIAWYRVPIHVGPDVTGPLMLQLTHWGASEVYLDGRLVGGFGRVGARPQDEHTRNPRWRGVLLPVRPGTTAVVAVRLSAWRQAEPTLTGRWLLALTPPGLGARLSLASTYMVARDRDHVENVALLVALAVAFAAFGLLHLLYFVLDRRDRQNLAFAMYAGSLTAIIGWQIHRELVEHTVLAGALFETGALLLLAVLGISLVMFVYASRGRAVPAAAKALGALQAGLVAVLILVPSARWLVSLGASCQLALVAIALLAASRSRGDATQGRPALIVAALAGGTPLILTGFEALGVPLAPASRTLLIQAGLAMVLVLATVAQARRFSTTSRDLRRQLQHIQELSARERARDRAEAEVRVEQERQRAELERQTHELEEARTFQLSLLPSRLPELAGWEAAASMQTASEVGGDYFDVRRMADGVATLVIGDATGHGLRAGTLVATTKGLFQVVGDSEDLGRALQVMGAALRDLRLRGLFMALTIVRLHPDGRVEVAAAGMPPAVLIDADGQTSTIAAPAPPLGAPIRFAYETRTVHVRSGGRLVLMTDGVPERLDGRDELFGYANVPALAAAHRDLHGADYIRALEADLDAFAGRPPADDATLLVITRQ
jgi:serine phosphatase RsbU (regulator of sigma subunit)